MQEIERNQNQTVWRPPHGGSEGVIVGSAVRIGQDRLAVDDCGLGSKRSHQPRRSKVLAGPVHAVACVDPRVLVLEDQLGSISVILNLVNPRLAFQGFFDEGGQLELDKPQPFNQHTTPQTGFKPYKIKSVPKQLCVVERHLDTSIYRGFGCRQGMIWRG